MEEIFAILIGLIVDLVIVILCAGFLGCMICDGTGVEFDGGIRFLSVIICFAVFGLPIWLIYKYVSK